MRRWLAVCALLWSCGGGGKHDNPLAANGATCASASECASGACSDGVCCDSACTGQCESCTGATPGTCTAVTGAPVGSRAACTADDAVCGGTCDGVTRDSCTYPTVECGAASCAGTMATGAAHCAAGACQGPPVTDCTATADTKVCGATACAGVTDVAGGGAWTCALLSDRTVKCWGNNFHGVISAAMLDAVIGKPTQIAGLDNVAQLSASPYSWHECAVLMDGTLKCWGDNRYGQLGLGTMDNVEHPAPTTVTFSNGTPLAVKSISTGTYHTCALLTDRSVWCWGRGIFGRLADGNAADHYSLWPQQVLPSGTVADSILTGEDHTCATLGTTTTASVLCWGTNSSGECGVTASSSITGATTATGIANVDGSRARPLALGSSTSCAIASDTTLRCWGNNQDGELGRGSATFSANSTSAPVCKDSVPGCSDISDQLTDVTDVALGETHGCAIASGELRCWGGNSWGMLATGDYNPVYYAGAVPTLPLQPTRVTAGQYHTCVVLSDRTVRCWGRNLYGELGIDDATVMLSQSPTTPAW